MFGALSIFSSDTFNLFAEKTKAIFADFIWWREGLDILILCFAFYFALKFLKNRKAGTLLIGIAVCLVLYVVADKMELTAVKFLLDGIFKIGFLAIIIIFQPDIRDMLETIGSGSIKGIKTFSDKKRSKQAQFKAIDNICKAVHVMSAEKTGALIVIGRTTQLVDVLQTGIEINADVSDYLLRNLFFDKAPLHDGAVVIEGNRIKAAACILPLPKHTHVHNALGTRHRAAIGLSEVSDAIIIIVSEETGVISIAKESELKRNFTEDSLRKFLVNELVKSKENQENN